MSDHRTHFHVGIIVEELESARRRLTELVGVTWGPIMRVPAIDVRDEHGNDIQLPSNICYSAGDPAIELIEEVPGSVWVRNPHSNLHHIGFWSGDLGVETAALTGSGCPVQLCGRSGSLAPAGWAYHGVPDLGVRIEMLDQSMQEMMGFLFRPDQNPL